MQNKEWKCKKRNMVQERDKVKRKIKKIRILKNKLLFTRHYPARCFGMNMPKSRDIQREFMRLA